MKLRLYSVRDNAVGAFMRPFVARSDGEATRNFGDEANSPESALAKHPEDYALFFVGEFDELTGVLEVPPAPHSMGLAISYKRKEHGEQIPLPLAVSR